MQRALKYLAEEKSLNFLEAAEDDPDFHAEIPAFVAEIKIIFEPWQLRECLERARTTEPFDMELGEMGRGLGLVDHQLCWACPIGNKSMAGLRLRSGAACGYTPQGVSW